MQSLNSFLPLDDQAIKDQHTIEENKKIALQLETKAQTYINNIVKPVTDILSASFPACIKAVTQLRNEAIIDAALVSNEKIEVDRSNDGSTPPRLLKTP